MRYSQTASQNSAAWLPILGTRLSRPENRSARTCGKTPNNSQPTVVAATTTHAERTIARNPALARKIGSSASQKPPPSSATSQTSPHRPIARSSRIVAMATVRRRCVRATATALTRSPPTELAGRRTPHT